MPQKAKVLQAGNDTMRWIQSRFSGLVVYGLGVEGARARFHGGSDERRLRRPQGGHCYRSRSEYSEVWMHIDFFTGTLWEGKKYTASDSIQQQAMAVISPYKDSRTKIERSDQHTRQQRRTCSSSSSTKRHQRSACHESSREMSRNIRERHKRDEM